MNNPLISVVMPVYNSEQYLTEAIESILNQTHENFEFIIINDGSTDNSLKIIHKYINIDNRVILINRENKGIVYSLNEGINAAKGKYIARMDSDDISLPTRLEEQIKFMEMNCLDVCGTSASLFRTGKILGQWDYPASHNEIKFVLMFMSAFAHPTVMIKREVFKKINYRDYKAAEDYRLWCDIAIGDFKMANISKVLLLYRLHNNQSSNIKNKEQRQETFEISKDYIKSLGQYSILKKLEEIKGNTTKYNLEDTYNTINLYRKDKGIKDAFFLEVARILLKSSNPISLSLYLTYKSTTRNIKKDFKTELYLLIQSLFSLNRESRLYQYLKQFV